MDECPDPPEELLWLDEEGASFLVCGLCGKRQQLRDGTLRSGC